MNMTNSRIGRFLLFIFLVGLCVDSSYAFAEDPCEQGNPALLEYIACKYHITVDASPNAGGSSSSGPLLGYTNQENGKSNGFGAQFSLAYDPVLWPQMRTKEEPYTMFHTLSFIGDVDGSFTSGSAKDLNTLNFRSELKWEYANNSNTDPKNEMKGWSVRFGPVYQVTQNFDVQDLFVEQVITATKYGDANSCLYIGGYKAIIGDSDNALLRYFFRPWMTFQEGGNLKGKDSTEELNSVVLRIIPDFQFSIDSPKIAKALMLSEAVIKLEENMTILPLEGKTLNHDGNTIHSDVFHQQFSASLMLGLGKKWGVGFSYLTGETAPTFKYDHKFIAGITINKTP